MDIAQAVYEAYQDSPKKTDSITERLGKFLQNHNMLHLSDMIARDLEFLVKEQEQKSRTHVTSATELSDAERSQIAKMYDVAADDLIVTIGPKLVGGVRVQSGGYLYDASLQTRLHTLQKTLETIE